jgi:hypothetical protein
MKYIALRTGAAGVVGADTPAVKNERCDDTHHTNTQSNYLFPPKQAPRNMKLVWVSRWSDTTLIGRVLICDHPCCQNSAGRVRARQ